jgi:hypothetical protein
MNEGERRARRYLTRKNQALYGYWGLEMAVLTYHGH